MVVILPGLDTDHYSNDLTEAQIVSFVVERYLLIGLYTFLFVLVIVNIWNILIKQKKYKTLPLTAFYIFAYFSITFRLIYIILEFSKYEKSLIFINDLYLGTKISVGLIQSWMILEIALRIRETYKETCSGSADRLKSFKKWVQRAQYCIITVAFSIILIILVDDIFTVDAYMEALKNGEEGNASDSWFAFSFLNIFFLMAAVNIVLICVMRKRKKKTI